MLYSAMATELPDTRISSGFSAAGCSTWVLMVARGGIVSSADRREPALQSAGIGRTRGMSHGQILRSAGQPGGKGFAHVVQEKTKLFSAVEPNLAVPSYLVRRSQVLHHELTEQSCQADDAWSTI